MRATQLLKGCYLPTENKEKSLIPPARADLLQTFFRCSEQSSRLRTNYLLDINIKLSQKLYLFIGVVEFSSSFVQQAPSKIFSSKRLPNIFT